MFFINSQQRGVIILCHGHKNGKPLDSGTTREHSGKKCRHRFSSPGSPKTAERRYLRCIAEEKIADPERPEGSRGKKFRVKRIRRRRYGELFREAFCEV